MDNKEKKGSYKKKGAAESVKQEKKDLNKMPGDVKQMDTPPARKKGGAKYKEEGVADFKGGLHAKNTKHSESGEHLGAKRMGFTQNFGAARQNSYAQGAAKVASIMSFGASKKKGAADHIAGHPASEIKLNNVAPSGGVKTNHGKQSIINLIKSQGEYDANTTQVSRNLAELDSLKMVASGQEKKAQDLYSDYSGFDDDSNASYDSSKPLPINPYGTSSSNVHVQARIANKKRLREDAKVIQGPRPTL